MTSLSVTSTDLHLFSSCLTRAVAVGILSLLCLPLDVVSLSDDLMEPKLEPVPTEPVMSLVLDTTAT